MSKTKTTIIGLGVSLLFIGPGLADPVDIPNQFEGGTPAVADEVNQNFSAVEAAIDDNAADIAANVTAIDALQTRVDEQEAVEITVVCADGDTVTAALASVARTTPVTITIQGICTEGVGVFRDDVILRGSTPADGITGAGGGFGVFVSGRTVLLQSLTISGGTSTFGLGCLQGSVVLASDITVMAGTFAGVLATEGAVCQLTNSIINGGSFGMLINANGHATLRSSVIQNSTVGAVTVEDNGSLLLGATISPAGTASILRNNARAGSVSLNSSIRLSNAIIEDNGIDGLAILPGGALLVGPNETAIIRNNGGDGLRFSPNTSAIIHFSSDFTISGHPGFGLNCDAGDNGPARGNVSITGGPSTNTGNASGAFSGNCP